MKKIPGDISQDFNNQKTIVERDVSYRLSGPMQYYTYVVIKFENKS